MFGLLLIIVIYLFHSVYYIVSLECIQHLWLKLFTEKNCLVVT